MIERLQTWAAEQKRRIAVLYAVYMGEDAPWMVRAICFLPLALAFSPFRLFGRFDDLVVLPTLIFLAVRLVPYDRWRACAAQPEADQVDRIWVRYGACVTVGIWVMALLWVIHLLFRP